MVQSTEVFLQGISLEQLATTLWRELEGRFIEALATPETEEVKYLTRKETAKMLSISLPTLWDWTNKGLLSSYRLGNKVYYKSDEIDQSLQPINRA